MVRFAMVLRTECPSWRRQHLRVVQEDPLSSSSSEWLPKQCDVVTQQADDWQQGAEDVRAHALNDAGLFSGLVLQTSSMQVRSIPDRGLVARLRD